jgi:hypothetical protein
MGEVVARVAVGRVEIVRIFFAACATARTTQSRKSPLPVEVPGTGVVKMHRVDDGVPDVALIGPAGSSPVCRWEQDGTTVVFPERKGELP